MKTSIAIVAALLAIAGNVPYLRDIIQKKVKPHPYTWLVWTIVSCIVFFGQVARGAGIGALSTAASEIFTVIIFLLSLKYGFKNIRRIDTYCLIIALVGIVPWLLTKDPTISVVIAVSIDLFAFSSTVRKTWNEPKTETPTLYGMNVLRHIVTLFSFEAYNVATTLHSIVMIAANSLMTGLILSKNPKRLDKMKGRLMVAFQRLTRSSAPATTILIRILVGAVFFSEGIQKFLLSDALGVGRFAKIGIPEPLIVATFVGVVEIAFGASILLGFLTRLSAVPLLMDISVAIATTKVPMLVDKGFWSAAHEARTDVSMLLGLIFLLIVGAGPWSVDARLFRYLSQRK